MRDYTELGELSDLALKDIEPYVGHWARLIHSPTGSKKGGTCSEGPIHREGGDLYIYSWVGKSYLSRDGEINTFPDKPDQSHFLSVET